MIKIWDGQCFGCVEFTWNDPQVWFPVPKTLVWPKKLVVSGHFVYTFLLNPPDTEKNWWVLVLFYDNSIWLLVFSKYIYCKQIKFNLISVKTNSLYWLWVKFSVSGRQSWLTLVCYRAIIKRVLLGFSVASANQDYFFMKIRCDLCL